MMSCFTKHNQCISKHCSLFSSARSLFLSCYLFFLVDTSYIANVNIFRESTVSWPCIAVRKWFRAPWKKNWLEFIACVINMIEFNHNEIQSFQFSLIVSVFHVWIRTKRKEYISRTILKSHYFAFHTGILRFFYIVHSFLPSMPIFLNYTPFLEPWTIHFLHPFLFIIWAVISLVSSSSSSSSSSLFTHNKFNFCQYSIYSM